MSKKGRVHESVLERATEELRSASPSPEVVVAAAERVWARINAPGTAGTAEKGAMAVPGEGEPLRSCADYQALMPSLVAGTLPQARRLLVEDHSRECIPCRRALQAARAGRQSDPASKSGRGARPWARAAAVAGAALGAGLLAWLAWTLVPVAQAEVAQVRSVDGELFVVGDEGRRSLLPGDFIAGGEEIRTAPSSGAVVRLSDGSVVEIDERSSVLFRVQRSGERIRVGRGAIIVEASEQGSGHLDVSTDELLVSVKGTIFAVSHGTKGSRVSVIEGEVRVDDGKQETTLLPGDQLGTRTAAPVAFERELAWSRNVDHYLEVLQEFAALRRDLNQIMAAQQPRFSTRLLDLAPAETVVWVAIPNPTVSVAEVYRLLRERIAANPSLAAWWRKEVDDAGFGAMADGFVEEIRALGEYLGEEVAVSLTDIAETRQPSPVILAEVTNGPALAASLEARFAELQGMVAGGAGEDGTPTLVIVDDPFAAQGDGESLLVWIDDDVLVASTSAERLREVAGTVQGSANPFVGSPFYDRLAASYTEGAQYLGGVSLGQFLPDLLRREDAAQRRALELSGLADVEHLIVEREQDEELAHTAATLSFQGPRRGIVSWLAEPGPMGALEFISPEASFVGAFLVEDPATILDQVLAAAAAEDEDFSTHLGEVEAGLGFRPQDVALALGGEVAFALDGPALPEPSWKLVVEVKDERLLQNVLEQAAARVAEAAGDAGGLSLETLEADGRTFYRLTAHVAEGGEGSKPAALLDGRSVVYAYHDGYLVAAPTQDMVEQAILLQEGGVSFIHSSDFRALLPRDGYIDVSALVFNRLGEVLGGLFDRLASSAVELTDEQRRVVAELEAEVGPSLFVAYGERDRIRVVSNGPAAFPFLGVGQLFGLSQLMDSIDSAAGPGGTPWR